MFTLKAKNITKSYQSTETSKLTVLKDISVIIGESDTVSIVGASGVGKSTLLHILGTIDKPDSGELTLNDGNGEIDLTKTSDKKLNEIRNKSIGFIFQFHHLLPEFSALENILMPALVANGKMKEIEERATELLNFIGLKERADHKPSKLSGGEQQRVAVARALMNNPKLILADEPTGNLDENNSEMIISLFEKINSEFNTAILTTTHSKEVAEFAKDQFNLSAKGLVKIN